MSPLYTQKGKNNMQGNDNIKKAIYNMGGPTVTGEKLRVSRSAISKWIRLGRIPNWKLAKVVAQESGFAIDLLRPTFPQGIIV